MEVDSSGLRLVDADGNVIPIKWGYYVDKNGNENKVIFVGHEKAIYGSDGETLDKKLGDIKGDISDEFSEETDYLKGDYCIRDNKLYKFTEDKEASEWSENSAVQTTLSKELGGVIDGVSESLENINFDSMLVTAVINTDFQSGIKSIVRNNQVLPFTFFNTTNNPFSFENGFGLAFYVHGLSYSAFVIAFNGSKVEVKTIALG